MSDKTAIEQVVKPDWMPKAIIIGGVMGALVGTLAAYLFVQNAKDADHLEITPGEGIKIGLLVFGLLRNVANLAGD